MDGNDAFFTFGGKHEEFDLAARNEIDHFVLIPAHIHVCVSLDRDRLNFNRLSLQRIAQLLLEMVGLRSLLDHEYVLNLLRVELFKGLSAAGLLEEFQVAEE